MKLISATVRLKMSVSDYLNLVILDQKLRYDSKPPIQDPKLPVHDPMPPKTQKGQNIEIEHNGQKRPQFHDPMPPIHELKPPET